MYYDENTADTDTKQATSALLKEAFADHRESLESMTYSNYRSFKDARALRFAQKARHHQF